MNLVTLSITWGSVFGACGFALWKGASAERIGAAAYALSALTYLAFQLFTGTGLPIVHGLFMDFAVAFTFLVLAIRFNNLWLGAAMMVKGAQFSLHAMHLMDLGDPHLGKVNLYAAALNLISLAISGILIAATFASLRARRAVPERANESGSRLARARSPAGAPARV